MGHQSINVTFYNCNNPVQQDITVIQAEFSFVNENDYRKTNIAQNAISFDEAFRKYVSENSQFPRSKLNINRTLE